MHVKNKSYLKLTRLCLLVVFLTIANTFNFVYASSPEPYRIKTVVIDAGHGGKDSGARGKRSFEKDIVLAVALKVGEYIEKNIPDVNVVYTRSDDVFVPLDERSRIANENSADLFISIHCNANPSRNAYGTETYVMGLHRSADNLDVAMRENAVITYEEDYTSKYEGYDPHSAESFIIFNLMQDSFLEQSLNMASLVQDEFRDRARRRDRGVKQAGFIVLWKTSMPSVLVELGFLSNPKEEEYLMTTEGQTYLASAIYRAFREYKERVEARSTFTAESYVESSIEAMDNQDAISASTSLAPSAAERKEATFSKGVQFSVQITASQNPIPINSTFFKNLEGVEEFSSNGLYKYIIGNKQSYSESVEFCQHVREIFPDAFIVAFKDGEQIPLDQARRLTSN